MSQYRLASDCCVGNLLLTKDPAQIGSDKKSPVLPGPHVPSDEGVSISSTTQTMLGIVIGLLCSVQTVHSFLNTSDLQCTTLDLDYDGFLDMIECETHGESISFFIPEISDWQVYGFNVTDVGLMDGDVGIVVNISRADELRRPDTGDTPNLYYIGDSSVCDSSKCLKRGIYPTADGARPILIGAEIFNTTNGMIGKLLFSEIVWWNGGKFPSTSARGVFSISPTAPGPYCDSTRCDLQFISGGGGTPVAQLLLLVTPTYCYDSLIPQPNNPIADRAGNRLVDGADGELSWGILRGLSDSTQSCITQPGADPDTYISDYEGYTLKDVRTVDRDQNGWIDGLQLTFAYPINDSSMRVMLQSGCTTIFSNDSGVNLTFSPLGIDTGDQPDDGFLYITFPEQQQQQQQQAIHLYGNTDSIPTLQLYNSTICPQLPLKGWWGGEFTWMYNFPPVNDGAALAITSNVSARDFTATFTISEITYVLGNCIASALSIFYPLLDSASDRNNVTVTFMNAITPDQFGQVIALTSACTDEAMNFPLGYTPFPLQQIDFTAPKIINATALIDPAGDGSVTTIFILFTEVLWLLPQDNLTSWTVAGTQPRMIEITDNTVVLTVHIDQFEHAFPYLIQYNGGSLLSDYSGNQVKSGDNVILPDTIPPSILGGYFLNTHSFQLYFSEPVNTSCGSNAWSVTNSSGAAVQTSVIGYQSPTQRFYTLNFSLDLQTVTAMQVQLTVLGCIRDRANLPLTDGTIVQTTPITLTYAIAYPGRPNVDLYLQPPITFDTAVLTLANVSGYELIYVGQEEDMAETIVMLRTQTGQGMTASGIMQGVIEAIEGWHSSNGIPILGSTKMSVGFAVLSAHSFDHDGDFIPDTINVTFSGVIDYIDLKKPIIIDSIHIINTTNALGSALLGFSNNTVSLDYPLLQGETQSPKTIFISGSSFSNFGGQSNLGTDGAIPIVDSVPPRLLNATGSVGSMNITLVFTEPINLTLSSVNCSLIAIPAPSTSAPTTYSPTTYSPTTKTPTFPPTGAPITLVPTTAAPTIYTSPPTKAPSLRPTLNPPTRSPIIRPTKPPMTLAPTTFVRTVVKITPTASPTEYTLSLSTPIYLGDFSAGVKVVAMAQDLSGNKATTIAQVTRGFTALSAVGLDLVGDDRLIDTIKVTFTEPIILVDVKSASIQVFDSSSQWRFTTFDVDDVDVYLYFTASRPVYGTMYVELKQDALVNRLNYDIITLPVDDQSNLTIITVPTHAPTLPAPSGGGGTCQLSSVAQGPFWLVSADCTPVRGAVFATVTLYNGETYTYGTPLPVLLPCGAPREVALSDGGSWSYSTAIPIPCPDGATIDSDFTPQALTALTTALQSNSSTVSAVAQRALAITEALALTPPLSPAGLPQRRTLRSQFLYQFSVNISTWFLDKVSAEGCNFFIRQDLVKIAELSTDDVLRTLRASPSVATVAAGLNVITSFALQTADGDQTNAGETLVNRAAGVSDEDFKKQQASVLLNYLESFSDATASLMGNEHPTANYSDGEVAFSVERTLANSSELSQGMSSSITNLDRTMSVSYPRDFASFLQNAPYVDCVLMSVPAVIIAALTSTGQPCETSDSVLSLNCFLPDGSPLPIENLDPANPLKLVIPHRLAVNGEQSQCSFWENTTNELDTGGCVTEEDVNSTTCLCTHATIFALKYFPTANRITDRDFTKLTKSNVIKNPVPLITVCILTLVFALMGIFAYKRDKREDNETLKEEKRKKYTETVASPGQEPLLRAFIHQIRVNHMWVSVVWRLFGDPFRSRFRLACLAATVYLTFLMNGVWFSTRSRSADNVMVSAVVCSLCALVVTFPLGFGFQLAARRAIAATMQGHDQTSEAKQSGKGRVVVDHKDPRVKVAHRIMLACSFLAGVCVVVCALLIIVLGLTFDLGDPECLPKGSCFCTIALVRQKASLSWLGRCFISMALDIFIFRPVFIFITVVLYRQYNAILKNGWCSCCCRKSKTNTYDMALADVALPNRAGAIRLSDNSSNGDDGGQEPAK